MANRREQEQRLVDAARAALGDDAVVAAGIFGWQDLMKAQVVGGTVLGVGLGTVTANGLAGAAGAGVGGRLAKEEMAAAHGMTMQLLVAVSLTSIAVFNWDGHAAGDAVVTFTRSSTDVGVSGMGLSRIVKLHDRDSGAQITLHATVAPYLAQSKPDKHVLAALVRAR